MTNPADGGADSVDHAMAPAGVRRPARLRRTLLGGWVAVAVVVGGVAAVVVARQGSGASFDRVRVAAASSVVPGASDPSPFPAPINETAYRDACSGPLPVDAAGRLTASVSVEGQDIWEPAPPSVATGGSREQVLDHFASSEWAPRPGDGHAVAAFGLLSAPAPATILPDGGSSPWFQRTPLWLVAVCDNPPGQGSGGGSAVAPPAPGTSPSPGAPYLGVEFTAYDTRGRQVDGVMFSNRPSDALRAESFVHVPWRRLAAVAGDDPRQVRIAYPDAAACATFDHLDIFEYADSVHVRVWLRLLADGPASCSGSGDRVAVVGLTTPLGDRALVDGGPLQMPPQPHPVPNR